MAKGKHPNQPSSQSLPTRSAQTPARSQPSEPKSATEGEARLVQVSAGYSGPIPHPAMLRALDQVVPGAARDIIDAYREQERHRQDLERTVIRGDSVRSSWGVGLGFAAILAFLGTGGWLVFLGHDAAGATIATGPTAAILAAFIYGTNSRRAEREAKQKTARQNGESEEG